MSLSGIYSVKSYTASASQTEFDYPYAFFADSDIKVSIQSTAGVISTPTFTVAATNGDPSQGGTITLSTGATAGDQVTISREVPVTQEYDLQEGSTIDPKALNTAFDRAVAQNQQQQSENQRSVIHPIDDPKDSNGVPTLSYDVPSVANRANKVLAYDASGNVTVNTFSTVAGDAVTGGNGIDISSNVVSVDNSTDFTFTTGKLALATDSVDTAEIKDNAVTTAKLPDSTSTSDGVTLAKLQHIATDKVLGRTTASDGDVELLDLKDEDTMTSNSDTAVATQQSIKAYVDLLRPKYIAISGTSGSTALSQTTGGTNVGGSTATFTYTLSELTGGTGLDSTKFTDIYVMCKCDVKQFSGDSTSAVATIEATFPDGTVHKIMDLRSPSAEDDRQILEQVIKIPINVSQTTLVLTHTVSGSTSSGATHQCDTTILGASQFKV